MATELDALRAIADHLIQSNPQDPATWDLDLSPCIPIARAHLQSWSTDSQHREDRRARGKQNVSVWKSNKSTGGTFIMDSKLETKMIRKVRTEKHGLNKSNNKIANSCAELFLSRTSLPYYYGEQTAYPVVEEIDKQISAKVKDVWVYLRNSSGSLNHSMSDDFWRIKLYNSMPVRIELFGRGMLVDDFQASTLLQQVYPNKLVIPALQGSNPSIQPGLGASLHEMKNSEDKLLVAALACRGTFSALLTWNHFNTMLVQGGWPWLRQYSRAYARMVYTVMVLIFAAIENYDFHDVEAMRMRLLSLAGKLVGGPMGQLSPWKVRQSPYLKEEKLTIPLRVEGLTSEPPVPVQSQGGMALPTSKPKNIAKAIFWMDQGSQIPRPQALPSHIVCGRECVHGQEKPYTGRVKEAHSLVELDLATSDEDSVTIAMTWGAENSRNEVIAWVMERSMLTVQKRDDQCLRCAVNLAHCLGALVVIC